MGIQGLLPQLKSIMVPIHVQDLRGQSVAVDTYSWLHKGALSCSTHLCKGQPTSRHIDYCMHRVNLLRHHGVKPILVFDGGLLPMKIDQETKRSRVRKENLERAIEHESTGNSAAAFECYQKAVDISPSIAYELIQVLKQENVDYIVAPYEADAQMTFLSIHKCVDAVITEDSDLIPFGCSRIIFKMDKFGQGVEFKSSMLGHNKELDFTGFTKKMVLEMCIFSGCDYLQSLPGMGLKRAHSLVQKFKSYDKIIKHLKYSAISVPPLYEESFKKAMWTFQHQRVYDPTKEDIVHLSDIPHGLSHDLEYLGPWLPQNVAKGIAEGDLDPFTKLPFQGKIMCAKLIVDKTYSVKEFAPASARKSLDLPVQKNVLTNYFCLASLEAKRKFRAPKFIPKHSVEIEESSPSSENHVSDIPGSAKEAVTSMTNFPQGSLLNSIKIGDEFSLEDSMEDKISTKTSQLIGFSSYGNLNRSPRPCSMLESKHENLKPCLTSHKEHGHKSASNSVESSNTGSINRKATLKSSYFQNKLLDENDNGNQNEELITNKEDASGVICDFPVSKGASLGNDYQKSAIKKRKLIHVHNVHKGAQLSKHVQPTSVLINESKHFPDLTDQVVAMNKDGNFGCDISHVNDYSGIAEKSMERFVSFVSSFRYISSGSRASGLRAPLKDVQNTCSIRLDSGFRI